MYGQQAHGCMALWSMASDHAQVHSSRGGSFQYPSGIKVSAARGISLSRVNEEEGWVYARRTNSREHSSLEFIPLHYGDLHGSV